MKEIFGVGCNSDVIVVNSRDYHNLPPLRVSILKWEFIARNIRAIIDDGGRRTCALCSRYWHSDCVGCPVARKTGKKGCLKTPFETFARTGSFQAALAEVRFLKSLLRKKKRGTR